MRHYFEYDDMQFGYQDLVLELIRSGRQRSPRGMPTLEIPNATVKLNDPRKSWPEGIGRRYSKAIAAAEAMSLVGGTTDPALMVSVGGNFKRFLDGGVLHGAYGPRIRAQLPVVEQKLRADKDTRQAVVEIWDARYDQGGWTPKDLPCTLMFIFTIFDDKLEMEAIMRSSDVWWGVAHDYPQFTTLQLTMASALGLEPGPFTHHAISLHIYERDLEAARELSYGPTVERWPGGGVYAEGGIEQGMFRARAILAGDALTMKTPAERFYVEQLRGHRRLKDLVDAEAARKVPAVLE